RRAVAIGMGLLPGILAVAWLNAHLYGSPLRSGYGTLSQQFSIHNVLTNLRHYLSWFAEANSWLALLGLIVILLPLPALWQRTRDRSILVLFAVLTATLWGEYLAYTKFHADEWWYLRFLLPCWPLMMIGLANVFDLFGRSAG